MELTVDWAAEVTGDAAFRIASAVDAVAGVQPSIVVEPADAEELATVLRRAAAAGISVLPRGGGTKTTWGHPPRSADLILSTRRMDAVVAHAAGDLTVTVQAGCTIERLQGVLAEHRQRLALDPLFPASATVGGVLVTSDTGSLRGTFGPPRDQVIGITAALADGTLARSGGRVVKNVAGYDLPKLFAGSFGTLGVITEATFRLHPLPHVTRTVVFGAPGDREAARFAHAVYTSSLAASGVQFRTGGDGVTSAAVRLDGFAERSIADRLDRLMRMAADDGLSAGEEVPDGSVWSERERLYSRAPGSITARIAILPASLFPLLQRIRSMLADAIPWDLVAQAAGVADLRTAERDLEALAAAAAQVAVEVRRLGGSMVIREADPALLAELDVWGPAGNSLPLMQRVKAQFDPEQILNPGRFVGGI